MSEKVYYKTHSGGNETQTKKFLDYEGVKYLWSKISMQDYPNNETLISVIEAIDETKADKTEIPFIDDTLVLKGAAADAKTTGEAIAAPKYVAQDTAPEDINLLWIDTSDEGEDYVNYEIPEMQLAIEYAIPEKFMGKQVYQTYFKLDTFPTQGTTSYIENDILNNIETVLELIGTVDKSGYLCGTFSYGGYTLSLGFDKQQYDGAPCKIFVDNKMDSTYFDANASAIIKIKYTKS